MAGLRVLFCTRENANQRHGGDTVQMIETKAALQKLRIEVRIWGEDADDFQGFDLVHIFNIQTPAAGLKHLQAARTAHKPVVLSTIYWDMRAAWRSPDFLHSLDNKRIRRIANVSPRIAGGLFELEQKYRYRHVRDMAILAREVDRLMPNSIAELEIIVRDLDYPEARAKATIVPNAVRAPDLGVALPTEVTRTLETLPSEFVLEVARIEPVKGQLKLIQGLDRWLPDAPLVLIGNVGDRSYLRSVEAALARRKDSVYLGPVEHRHLHPFYRRARVHALPSLRESPGLATLEAGLAGCNCVAGVHAPVQEYFGDHVWLCSPEDEDSVGRAVARAWRNERRPAFAETIRTSFTWERAAELTLRAYEHALS